ncbi:MAG: hypothetical protein WA421_08595 [Nitrososphaeraceae archaeon]
MNKGLLIAKSNSDIVEIQILDGQQQNRIITAIVDKEVGPHLRIYSQA